MVIFEHVKNYHSCCCFVCLSRAEVYELEDDSKLSLICIQFKAIFKSNSITLFAYRLMAKLAVSLHQSSSFLCWIKPPSWLNRDLVMVAYAVLIRNQPSVQLLLFLWTKKKRKTKLCWFILVLQIATVPLCHSSKILQHYQESFPILIST